MRKSIFYLAVIVIFGFYGCSETGEGRTSDSAEEKDSLKAIAAAPLEKKQEKVFYPIPSPEQMFGFINDNGLNFNKELMNDVANLDSYSDPVSMALNFGVYTADLAYAAAYEDIETTIKQYKTVKKLGTSMNIAELMTEKRMEEMLSNLENKDSLALIAGKSYFDAVDYLEANDQEGKLALMSVGGWVESLYITVNSLEKFEEGSPTADRIADQKITFGNLYVYLKKHRNEVGVEKTINDLGAIRSVYASMMEETLPANLKKTSGKLILGGGKKIKMNEKQYVELKTAIIEYRTSIVS